MFLNKKLTDFLDNNIKLRKTTEKSSYNRYDRNSLKNFI